MDSAKTVNTSRNQAPRRPAQNEGLSPQTAWHAIRRWWKVAAPTAILLAVAASALVLFMFKKQYVAEATIRISQQRPHIVFPDKEGSERFVATQLEMLRTPPVLGPVAGNPEILRQPEIRDSKDAFRYLQRNVRVAAIGKSELYTISYTASAAADAKRVVEELVKSYIAHVASSDTRRRTELIRSLTEEINKRKLAAEELRGTLQSKSAEAGIAPSQLPPSLTVLGLGVSPVAELRSRLIQAEVQLVLLQAKLDYEQKLGDEDIEIPDSEVEQVVGTILAEHKSSLDQFRKQVEESKARSTGGMNSRLQSDMARLKEQETALANAELRLRADTRESLLAQARALRDANRVDLQEQYASAQITYKSLKDKLDAEEKLTGENVGDQLKLDFLARELQQAEGVCDMLMTRMTELSTEQYAPERVEPLLSPNGELVMAPEDPITSFPLKQLALALFASLCAPFGLAVVWERLAKRISTIEEIEQQVGIEVLGEIVTLPKIGTSRRAIQRSAESRHLFEESVDGLRTTLVLADSAHQRHVLAVASAVSSEGKTSVATELAISIARTTGKPTLLIDGDMRAPDIHRMFDVPVNPGLAEILAGEATLEDSVVETDSPSLSVLTAGMLTSSPHRLLHNGEFAQLVSQARKQYDYVIIDTPPVLAASESLVMARHADATLVCAMRDRTRVSHIQRAHSRLVAAGAQPIGVVMSGLPVRNYASRYGSYSYGKHA